MGRLSMTAAPSSWPLHTVGNGAAGAVTWDSSRVPGRRQPARVPGAVREMNLALRRRPPAAAAQTLFSPDAQNAIMGGTIQWRAQLPAHPTGTESRYRGRDGARRNKWTPSGRRPVANGTRMVCNQRLHRSGRSGRDPLNASSPAAR